MPASEEDRKSTQAVRIYGLGAFFAASDKFMFIHCTSLVLEPTLIMFKGPQQTYPNGLAFLPEFLSVSTYTQ
jgi:hypothetical protein